jgi:hypothetical protein
MRPLLGILVGLLAAALSPCTAGVTVILDSRTLNELLAAGTVHEVRLPLTASSSLNVLLEELTVTRLEPAPDSTRADTIHASLRVRVPSLGLDLRVAPRLALSVAQGDAGSVLELRFQELRVPLPLGAMDIAPFLAPQRYPADSVFQLDGAQPPVNLRSRLTRVRMAADSLRFEFELDVLPAEGS